MLPVARTLPAPGSKGHAFRIRRHESPPFTWQLLLEDELGDELAFSLPRGLPWSVGESRLAEEVLVEASASGPTWDEGRYRVEAAGPKEIVLDLEGRRVRGRYALRRDKRDYGLARLDPASVRPMPGPVLPMLAHSAPYPARASEYAFEPKWDGIRAIAHVKDQRATFRTRNLHDVTTAYPELEGLARALAGRAVVLDGEIVAPDSTGRPSFQRLQNRLGIFETRSARRLAEEIPVVYIAFDVLHVDGRDTTTLPYEERRAILESLGIDEDHWRVSPVSFGDGHPYLEMKGWEGVVAKKLGSVYEPGARSRAWVKVKAQRRQELVIGGWSAGKGGRQGQIGALLVGHYDRTEDEAAKLGLEQRLLYAGSVGTGFTQATLDGLQRLLAPLRRITSPFATPVGKKDVTYVEPRYVAEFEFTEWTDDGKLRHPSYKGLREDKDARQVVREEM